MKNRITLKKLVFTALFTALVCISTMIIQIPTVTNGYVNLGDCMVLISGFLLGPVYGTVAAAAGSALADLFAGYMIYVPGTFIIKGATALTGYVILNVVSGKNKKYSVAALSVSGVCGEAVMVLGYVLYESILPGISFYAALLSIPSNALQGGVGVFLSVLFFQL